MPMTGSWQDLRGKKVAKVVLKVQLKVAQKALRR